MMLTIHKKRFAFLKNTFISFFTNGANRPGVNRPVRKIVLERIVPGGTGFGVNRPVTHSKGGGGSGGCEPRVGGIVQFIKNGEGVRWV